MDIQGLGRQRENIYRRKAQGGTSFPTACGFRRPSAMCHRLQHFRAWSLKRARPCGPKLPMDIGVKPGVMGTQQVFLPLRWCPLAVPAMRLPSSDKCSSGKGVWPSTSFRASASHRDWRGGHACPALPVLCSAVFGSPIEMNRAAQALPPLRSLRPAPPGSWSMGIPL